MVRNGILESNIIIEVGSAANEIKNRPGFQNLIQNVLKESDTLVVTKIDRCARNTLEFLKLQDILFKRKIQFISLDLPYSEDLNINKLSFESENLVVDWISFNLQGSVAITPIANYLFQAFGFNSTITRIIKGKWKSKDLNYNSMNKFQISFRQHEYDCEFYTQTLC